MPPKARPYPCEQWPPHFGQIEQPHFLQATCGQSSLLSRGDVPQMNTAPLFSSSGIVALLLREARRLRLGPFESSHVFNERVINVGLEHDPVRHLDAVLGREHER